MLGSKLPPTIRYDSSTIELRTSHKIETYKNDKNFVYDDNVKKPITFFQKLLNYLFRFLETIFSDTGVVPFIRYFIYFLIFVLIIYLLFRMNFGSVFFRRKKSVSNVDLEIYDEDILHTNYEKLIQDAVVEKNYRLAVRFLYLNLLKKLAFKEIIHWEIDKTNKDYRNQTRSGLYGKSFENLTKHYEYVWYGQFQINTDFFYHINQDFSVLFQKLNV